MALKQNPTLELKQGTMFLTVGKKSFECLWVGCSQRAMLKYFLAFGMCSKHSFCLGYIGATAVLAEAASLKAVLPQTPSRSTWFLGRPLFFCASYG